MALTKLERLVNLQGKQVDVMSQMNKTAKELKTATNSRKRRKSYDTLKALLKTSRALSTRIETLLLAKA